jgi:hypothetical protein
MPDREKYIEILSNTAKAAKNYNGDIPIRISLECVEDILELLKKQEAVKPVQHLIYTTRGWFCGACDGRLNRLGKYCSFCGRKVKWE